ncbi:MAG: protein kinase [Xanthomonadales bacterium]|nr:protein kinase [Xanthomonadales bacterium]
MILPPRYKFLSTGALEGGFGAVIPLEDTFLRRVVFLKVMQDAKDNIQLQNEIKGLCRARSRHVVEIYDLVLGPDGDVSGVVIERLRGRDFLQFHKEAPSNPHGYLRVIYQLACALRDLHAVGVVHRDLKLENFKESSAGLIKLFDFGISSPEGGYKTKENKGTFVYAAPELYTKGAEITAEMDVYALGVCAWALASPNFPPQMLERPPQKSGRAPSIGTVMPTVGSNINGLHNEIVDLIDSFTDPDPIKRPNAADASEILAKHLSRNKHRGLFVFAEKKEKVLELSNTKRSATLGIDGLGSLKLTYDGLRFSVTAVVGFVSINNAPAQPGDALHEACVLGFGPPNSGQDRKWITFFSSHPEVTI